MSKTKSKPSETVMVVKMLAPLVWLVAVVVAAITDQSPVFVAIFAAVLAWTAMGLGMAMEQYTREAMGGRP